MEPWEGLVISGIVAAIGYLFVSKVAQGKSITSIEVKLDYIIATQNEMRDHMIKDKEENASRQKEINDKLNLFIKTEIDELKNLSNELIRQRKNPRNNG
jgi:low affinity Fe/Cu permease